MQQNRRIKWLLIAIVTVMMTACGGGGSGSTAPTAQDIAIAKIVTYAENNGSTEAPDANDYSDAGVALNGVAVGDINDYIATLDTTQVDSEEDIQQIADDAGVWLVDTDGDGEKDYADNDDDGDGVLDDADAFPLDASESIDTDGDHIGNNADNDDDGDGISDTVEVANGSNPLDSSDWERAFQIKVKTDNYGRSNNDQFVISTRDEGIYTYNYSVDCDSDGVDIVTGITDDYTCTYPEGAGEYVISITGDFPRIYFGSGMGGPLDDQEKVLEIIHWGTGEWETMKSAFNGCKNMISTTTSIPNLSQVTDMGWMFNGARSFNQNIGDWNVSTVKSMIAMFQMADSFNQDIGDWDVSHVEDMSWIFNTAKAFNQDIGRWDVSHVEDMNWMFNGAEAFDQNIEDWNTSNVKDMSSMFRSTSSFSGYDLSQWNVENVSNHHSSFMSYSGTDNIEPAWPHFIITVRTNNAGDSNDTSFTIPTDNVPGSTAYDYNVDCNNDGIDEATGVTEAYTCSYESAGTYTIVIKDNTGIQEGFPRIYFNNVGDKEKIVGINQWGIGKWTSMFGAFYGCSHLNAEGGIAEDRPDLSMVVSMYNMFSGASVFNQDIGDWDTSNVQDMGALFQGAAAFDRDIGGWKIANVTSIYAMFRNATNFNQDLSLWDTSNISNMNAVFQNASSFTNHDLRSWSVGGGASDHHRDFMTGAGTGNREPLWL
jgi:surface protein